MALKVGRVALATAIGLGTAIGLWALTLRQQPPANAAEHSLVPVLVVTSPIGMGERVTGGAIKPDRRPASYVPAGALSVPARALGRRAKADLDSGELLLDSQLYQPGQDAASTVLPVPLGRRAVTVAVDEVVGVAGFVMPGSVVDVVGTIDVDGQPVTRVLLQAIQVLAIAQDARKKDSAEAKVVSSATLAVTPKESEVLILAADRGKIRLAMRGLAETKSENLSAVTPASILGAPKVARSPVKVRKHPVRHDRPPLATPVPAILVIRGTQAEQVWRDER